MGRMALGAFLLLTSNASWWCTADVIYILYIQDVIFLRPCRQSGFTVCHPHLHQFYNEMSMHTEWPCGSASIFVELGILWNCSRYGSSPCAGCVRGSYNKEMMPDSHTRMHVSQRFLHTLVALQDGSLEGVEPLCLLPKGTNRMCVFQVSESQSGHFCDCALTATVKEATELDKYLCFKLHKPQQDPKRQMSSQRHVVWPELVLNPTNMEVELQYTTILLYGWKCMS